MNAELIALASGSAGTLVAVMTTDAWAEAKNAVVALWRKHRPAEGDDVPERLETSRKEVLAAAGTEREIRRQEAETRWRIYFEDLLNEHPDSATGLASLVSSIASPAASERAGSVTQVVSASRDAFTAGRDQTVNLRTPD